MNRIAFATLPLVFLVFGKYSAERLAYERDDQRVLFSTPVISAVESYPAGQNKIERGAFILYDQHPFENIWPFGGGGFLFRYAFMDPSITEVPYNVLDDISYEQAVKWLVSSGHAFGLEESEGAWKWFDHTSVVRPLLMRKVNGELSARLNVNLINTETLQDAVSLADVYRDQYQIAYFAGFANYKVGDLGRARMYLDRAHELNPSFSLAQYQLAQVMVRLGDMVGACKEYRSLRDSAAEELSHLLAGKVQCSKLKLKDSNPPDVAKRNSRN